MHETPKFKNDGISVIVPLIGLAPLFCPVKVGIVFVPLETKPIAVFELFQV